MIFGIRFFYKFHQNVIKWNFISLKSIYFFHRRCFRRRLTRCHCYIFAITWYKTVYTIWHCLPVTFCPCNMSHKVQQVELSAVCRRHKIVEKFVLQDLTFVRETPGGCVAATHIFRGHFPASCSRVCVSVCVPNVILSLPLPPVTCPCYMSPMCEQHMILSLQHVPASWPLVCGEL